MFIDEAEVYIRSGRGGDGMVHFHREKYVPRGGPDGGDGGRGGDVILEVVPTLNTLVAFRHKKRYIAPDGKKGGPNNMSGKSAEDLVIPLPPGTIVYDAITGELVVDLVEKGQRYVICKGGRGGRGNQHFATSRNQAPTVGEKGEPAEEKHIRLELKLIADVGIVGVPNAGKSSFLAAVTNAKPKIADYPFTTIEPNLGVANLNEDTTLVLADIPGLIEGAHRGVGLGDAFLRHIQRTRVIIHMLDGLAQDPMVDFSQINAELALFDENLAQKPQVVVFNKMDMKEAEARWPKIHQELRRKGYESLAISALTKRDLEPVLWKAAELLKSLPEMVAVTPVPVYKPEEDPRAFTVEREADGWRVRGKSIERAAAMTYWEYDDSLRRFQRMMEMIGVEKALRDAGAQEGDTVYIGENELEWSD